MQKRKVLFLSSWYPNRTYPTHGIFVKRHAEASALTNDVAVIYVCSDKDLKQDQEIIESTENGVYTIRIFYKKVETGLPVIKQLKKLNYFFKCYKKGLDLLFKKWGRPELVHLNILMPAGLVAWMIKKVYRIPYVVSENWTGYLPSDGNYKGFFLKYLTKKIALNSSHICPVSKDLEMALKGHGFKNNYTIVPNVVDTDVFIPADLVSKNDKFRFIHVSVLDDAQKNIKGMLRAIKKAHDINSSFEMVIVGDGPERRNLEKYSESLGLTGIVSFVGLKLRAELVNEFQKADAFILFSNYENLPCVVLEAMSCGLPVIATRAGGTAEHLNDRSGIIIDCKVEAALTNSILTMITDIKNYDRSYIREYAVNHFSMQAINNLFNQVYKSVN